jgi:hypothetical protein
MTNVQITTAIYFGVAILGIFGAIMLSGISAAVREYYDSDATVFYVLMAILWPMSLFALLVMAVWGILFGIGYLIGKFYRIFKPTTEATND